MCDPPLSSQWLDVLGNPGKGAFGLAAKEKSHNEHLLWRVRHDAVGDVEAPEEGGGRGLDLVGHLGVVSGSQQLRRVECDEEGLLRGCKKLGEGRGAVGVGRVRVRGRR